MLLDKKELFWIFIDIEKLPAKKYDMIALSGFRSIPQIFFNNFHIGGAEELLQLEKQHLLIAVYDYISYHDLFAYKSELPQLIDIVKLQNGEPQEKTLREVNFSIFSNTLDKRLLSSEWEEEDEATKHDFMELDETIAIPFKGPIVYSRLLAEMLSKVRFRDVRTGFFSVQKNCFVTAEAIPKLMDYLEITMEQCIEVCKALAEKGVFQGVNNNKFRDTVPATHKLAYHQIYAPRVLNGWYRWTGKPRCTMEVVLRLKKMLSNLINRHIISTNGLIDFLGIAADPLYVHFQLALCELQTIDWSSLNDDEKVAFIINCYNILIKHALTERGIPKGFYQIYVFFGSTYYKVGEHIFCFDDLENGILRANAGHPNGLCRKASAKDPRYALALPKVDYRIHFALNCGAVSCPAVRIYTKDDINEELNEAAMAFCESDRNVSIDLENRALYVSSIFNWYKEDFGNTKAELVNVLCRHCRGEKLEKLKCLTNHEDAWKLMYFKYDWSFSDYTSKAFS